jgi:hypothetical protein
MSDAGDVIMVDGPVDAGRADTEAALAAARVTDARHVTEPATR